MANKKNSIDGLLLRVETLEAEKTAENKVRLCMNRYMALCDTLDVGFDLSTLMVLFSKNATWQGAGKRYAKTFGRYEGRDAIAGMFDKYTKAPAHFELNAHFLCNELIEVDVKQSTAVGRWMLIQPSTFSSGKSQLSCARISAEFVFEDQAWVMSAFTTTNIFSRPMDEPWDNTAPLAVPTKAPATKVKPSVVKKKVTKKVSKKTSKKVARKTG
ncbi:MAG: hypothetical protein ACI9WC_001265 [Arenicella sp.]|jgi:hypothetical protein